MKNAKYLIIAIACICLICAGFFFLTQDNKTDEKNLTEIEKVIVKDLKNRNIGVLITDHNVHETLSITDRAYLLIEGSVFRYGTPQELANDEQVRKKYLGDNFELR